MRKSDSIGLIMRLDYGSSGNNLRFLRALSVLHQENAKTTRSYSQLD